MSLLTPWGYTLTDLNTLDSLLSVADFNTRTANKYSSDTRLATTLASASQIVRDFVGWHLYPSTACELSTTLYDCGATFVRNDLMIQLPARFVSGVTSVTIDGAACTDFVLEHNGILHVLNVRDRGLRLATSIVIRYTAGITDALMATIKDIVANRAIKSLVSSNGVQSETAGGVSISYSAAYMADASGPALSSPEEAAISLYKVKGVF